MNLAERKEMIIKIFNEEILPLNGDKGVEYANSDVNANANFDSDAEIGVSAFQSLGVFVNKHYRAMRRWIRTQETKSNETIEKRIHDIILYMFILLTMISEWRKKQQ